MISYLIGKVIELDFTSATILTSGGVGYEVGINELIYSKIALNIEVEMYIYHHIIEGGQNLFAFIEIEEKKVFSELIKISGIGGKVAMQILSLGVERLLLAIEREDRKTIEGIKGIGKKMAEKIILELKDKDFGVTIVSSESVKNTNFISSDLYSSIRSTLINMGYNSRDIDRILSELPEGFDNAGVIIPYVIRELS